MTNIPVIVWAGISIAAIMILFAISYRFYDYVINKNKKENSAESL
jgi:hypothetical protein